MWVYGDPAIRDQRLHDHDQRKTRSRTRSRIAKISPFLQITISRKTYSFSRKTIQFLVIENCRNAPLSANHDCKKYSTISQENYTISRDRELQKRATFCKSQSQEKFYNFSRKTMQFLVIATFCKSRSQEMLYNFSRKTIQFLMIANCRKGPLSANHDLKTKCTISQEKLYNSS